MNERMLVSQNPNQGRYKRVLCVCSAGILRSATAALVLGRAPYNYNTRAAGVADYALIPVDPVLIAWAHEIVTMTREQELILRTRFCIGETPIIVLDISDDFRYRQPELVRLIKARYAQRT